MWNSRHLYVPVPFPVYVHVFSVFMGIAAIATLAYMQVRHQASDSDQLSY